VVVGVVTLYNFIVVYALQLTTINPHAVYDLDMAAKYTPAVELTDPLIEVVSERFRVLGEPMRIKLLNAMRDGGLTVNELREATGASQQNVSKHLGVLHQAGMVARTKEGNQTRYSISDPMVFDLCELVCGGLVRQHDALGSILRDAAA